MHRLLRRQIKKTLGDENIKNSELEDFFNLISNYYDERDKERTLFENALVVNSRELTKSNEQLQNMAFHDALTGLTNRKLFEKELDRTIKQATRSSKKFALLFLDLDDFKTVNDSLGHDIGDELLIRVGQIIQSHIRESDVLARWGGDEFVLLLDELRSLEDCVIIIDYDLKTSFSIGINIYEDGQDVKEMIKNADMAMYLAKQAGKNQYSFYTSEIGEKVVSDLKLNEELIEAIEKHQFEVYYQPQIDIKSAKIIGAEALVRWNHPTKGVLYPQSFIGFCEARGYIIDIGIQVIEQGIRDIKKWLTEGYDIQSIAINLSVRQLKAKDFLPTLKKILQISGISTKYLEFEITETMLMEDYEYSFKVLDELSSLGIKISIDDFGTGYSSLSYLKILPIDKIKIDKSFIDEIEYDENDVEITKAIIAMSHSLNLEVLAEGVENHFQLDTLKKLGCDKYQGYHCSRPIQMLEFQKLLLKKTNS